MRVLYFGQARDASGTSEEDVAVPAGSRVSRVVEEATGRHKALARIRGSMQVALNEEMAGGSETVRDGDVVALLPPVAGG